MIVKKIQPEPHVEWTIDGTILFIGDIALDLESEQKDSQVIIDICTRGEDLVIGLGDRYVASILIPPARYEMVDSGEIDEHENPVFLRRKLPIDLEAVELVLWRYEEAEKEVV
ncbi:hypothetical protein [Acetomicrobium sp. S15 = DSM 107314]|uniref:hypothetical protein n=1 Tax=Acetomicrobium sp. S15 = DSM 107314 TaxID=2529858 RepID=UPI0018E0F57C|nr:hypothetical protein [Acetomicrobium sp. S15 = DSM 107314]